MKLFDSHDANCTKCEGDKRNQPVLGLEILWGLAPDGDEWSGGKILDPEEGKVYRCKLWLEGADRLKVRGYWGPFFRTQIWRRDR